MSPLLPIAIIIGTIAFLMGRASAPRQAKSKRRRPAKSNTHLRISKNGRLHTYTRRK